jgi:ribonuclease HI
MGSAREGLERKTGMIMSRITLYFDGSCEPNPDGFASIGVYVPELDLQISETMGEGLGMTSVLAEYQALLIGLRSVREHLSEGDELLVFGDSTVVIRQVKGEYRVKSGHLKEINEDCRSIIRELATRRVTVILDPVSRVLNHVADELSHRPLLEHPSVKKYGMCECGGIFVPRQGRYGEFLGCSHFPSCRKNRPMP